jgi:dCTP deaminase
MSLLSDVEIERAINSNEISIKPFEKNYLEPASYDIRARRALVSGVGIIELSETPLFIKTGDWAEIESIEEIQFSTKYAGSIGLRSSLTRRGIIGYGGPQIDPGYRGKAYFTLFNPSSETFKLQFNEKFATVQFFRLDTPASKPYSGPYQALPSFHEKDVEWMIKLKAPTLSDVVTSVQILENTVDKLTKNVDQLTTSIIVLTNDVAWIKRLLFAIFIAILVGIGIAVAGRFFLNII